MYFSVLRIPAFFPLSYHIYLLSYIIFLFFVELIFALVFSLLFLLSLLKSIFIFHLKTPMKNLKHITHFWFRSFRGDMTENLRLCAVGCCVAGILGLHPKESYLSFFSFGPQVFLCLFSLFPYCDGMCPLLFLEKGCTGDKNVEALRDKQNNDPKDVHILIPVGCLPYLLKGALQGD